MQIVNKERELNSRQRRFVEEYLVDRNATRAATQAGYSKKTAYSIGQRLLKQVEIKAFIDSKEEKIIEELEISQKYVLKTILDTVERCRQAKPVLNKKGEQVYCENLEGDVVPAYKFDSGAVLKGSELLGKFLGIFNEKPAGNTQINFFQAANMQINESVQKLIAASPKQVKKGIEGII